MEKILLDTDIGGDIDDAICLAYLLNEPDCELIGITTVCGEPENVPLSQMQSAKRQVRMYQSLQDLIPLCNPFPFILHRMERLD